MNRAVDSQISPATLGDIVELSQNMRAADRLEVLALTGENSAEVAHDSFERSKETWAFRVGGELVCVWGVADIWGELLDAGAVGVVWMLTTDAILRHKKSFFMAAKEFFPTLFDRWGTLVNVIDVRHEKALRWGKRMGFVFAEPRPLGVEGLDFQPFTVTLEDFQCAQSQQSPR